MVATVHSFTISHERWYFLQYGNLYDTKSELLQLWQNPNHILINHLPSHCSIDSLPLSVRWSEMIRNVLNIHSNVNAAPNTAITVK